MKAIFDVKRYFFANEGWYILMRPGDELNEQHHIRRRLRYDFINKITIAGPFKTKHAMKNWFVGFISFYGRNRAKADDYIPDEILLTDRN